MALSELSRLLSAEATPLTEQYRRVREATVGLCATLAPEDYVVQSMPDASPAKWHLAHTTWFFEEFVLQHESGTPYEFHDSHFRYLFNSYYNAVGPMHTRSSRGLLSRPTVQEVLAYRKRVDERMLRLLENGLSADATRVLTLGFHHEQQHQELLLTDIKHLFSCNPLLPAFAQHSPQASRPAPALSYKGFEGGLLDIGHTGTGFAFDNELPRHRVFLAPFELANRPATNAEFLEFIRDGGYRNAALWLSDGWATVKNEQWTRPIYWSDSLAEEFTLNGGLRELDPHAPVCHLSCYEADAFARWAGARLPTEFEWEIASAQAQDGGNFVESKQWHPVPAAYPTPTGRTNGLPMLQMFGDVWEWTQSAYSPYPGYRTAAGALGEYNGKFMVNQLVLRGGSCATPRSHIRPTYRNFFNPAARWQFSGVRLARDLELMQTTRPLQGTPARQSADWRVAAPSLVADVLRGLQSAPKRLSPTYFYDERGSQLFDAICEVPEYYITRTETGILEAHAQEIADRVGPNALLVELGSGASTKTRLLLDRLPDLAAYVPVDISRTHLMAAAQRIAAAYPGLEVLPACADFTQAFPLPKPKRTPSRVVVFFPGSTIGNFDPPAAVELLKVMRRIASGAAPTRLGTTPSTATPAGGLVIGFDLAKDPAILERAYDDSAGVTAEFNLNVLRRLNRDLGADFDLAAFRHQAIWVPEASRIEMRLISTVAQTVTIAGEAISFAANEPIITEHCHKYTPELFAAQSGAAGWTARQTWADARDYFHVQYLEQDLKQEKKG